MSSCNHGDGTAAENLDYENCLKGCVASATITAAGSAATGGSGSSGTESANAMTTQTTGTDAGGKHTFSFTMPEELS